MLPQARPGISSSRTPEAPSWTLRDLLPGGFLAASLSGLSLGAFDGHPLRVAAYATIAAQAYGLRRDVTEQLRLAAAFHDIGKSCLPKRLLLKPGLLSRRERRVVEHHTIAGFRLLLASTDIALRLAATVALCHHENADGSGYPHGLQGGDIPLPARIVRVADVFDALTMARPYHAPLAEEEALSRIRSDAGTLFDPQVVEAFEEALEAYPAIGGRLRRFTGSRDPEPTAPPSPGEPLPLPPAGTD